MSYIGNQLYQVAFVTDSFSGTGSTTVFTMSVAPANTASVLVVVSGVVQDPSTYSVSGTTLTFSAAPPSGTSNISARYLGIPASGVTTTAYRTKTEFTATAGQTTFTPPSYTVGYIDVFLNGVLLGSADYTATNGTTVVLTTGAAAGNLVTVESFYVSSVLNAIPNSPASVQASNIVTGAITADKMAASSVDLASTTVTGTLPAAKGGTGVTTFPSPGTSGNVLTSNGTNWTSAAAGGFTVGQTWQNMTSSRVSMTTYTNSTGKAIAVSAYTGDNAYTGTTVYIDGNIVQKDEAGYHPGYGANSPAFIIVPNGSTYAISIGPDMGGWWELR